MLRSYLNLAADNARALLAMLVVDDKLEVPLHAHYPLIRSVVEGAGMANGCYPQTITGIGCTER